MMLIGCDVAARALTDPRIACLRMRSFVRKIL